jgi:plasmid stability protein
MANLTLTIDEEVLKRARVHALERGTSVNALVREFLESFAHGEAELEAIAAGIDAIADAAPARRSSRWTRDELYAERLRRR